MGQGVIWASDLVHHTQYQEEGFGTNEHGWRGIGYSGYGRNLGAQVAASMLTAMMHE